MGALAGARSIEEVVEGAILALPRDYRALLARRAIDLVGLRVLADEIGVSPTIVHRYRVGSAAPTPEVTVRIARVLLERGRADVLAGVFAEAARILRQAAEALERAAGVLAGGGGGRG